MSAANITPMPSEHEEQVALFKWADYKKARWPELELMYAIPNGGKRDRVTVALLKAEGVKPGLPDICLPIGGPVCTSSLKPKKAKSRQSNVLTC